MAYIIYITTFMLGFSTTLLQHQISPACLKKWLNERQHDFVQNLKEKGLHVTNMLFYKIHIFTCLWTIDFYSDLKAMKGKCLSHTLILSVNTITSIKLINACFLKR